MRERKKAEIRIYISVLMLYLNQKSVYIIPSSSVLTLLSSLGTLSPISLNATTVKLYVTPGWSPLISTLSSVALTTTMVELRKSGSVYITRYPTMGALLS